MMELGKNLKAPPLYFLHATLQRFSPNSAYRSTCPICDTGVLMVSRNPETLQLSRIDRCTFCAQIVVYEDSIIAGEEVEPLSNESRKRLENIGD